MVIDKKKKKNTVIDKLRNKAKVVAGNKMALMQHGSPRNAYEELAPSENRPVHLSCHEAAEASHHDSTIKPCYRCTARRPRLGTMERRKTAKQTRVTGTR